MKNDAEMLDKLRIRIRKQNEASKDNWDAISCKLPKGTKDRIKKHGYTVNGLINEAVKIFLDALEETEEPELEPDQPEPVAVPEPEKPVKKQSMSLAELQKLIDEKRSENDARKERIEKAKEAQKEFEREETYRRDPDRKTDIQDASKAPEIEEEKQDKAFCKVDEEIQSLLEEAKRIEDTEEKKNEKNNKGI